MNTADQIIQVLNWVFQDFWTWLGMVILVGAPFSIKVHKR